MIYDPDKITQIFSLKGRRGSPPLLKDLNLQACCPFKHFSPDKGLYYEKNPSFGINLFSGQWNCYSCGMKGGSLDSLAFQLDVELPVIFRTKEAPNEAYRNEEFFDYTLDMFKMNQDKASEYLESRGIVGVTEKYNIGMSANGEQLFMPIQDPNGDLFGWVERNMNPVGNAPRYLLKPESINRKEVLFGMAQLDKKIRKGAFVESPMDALLLSSFGDNALASCGATVTDEQLERLLDFFDVIYLFPQNDKAGDSWLRKCEFYLKGRCSLFTVKLPEDVKDLGELKTPSRIAEVIKSGTKMVR